MEWAVRSMGIFLVEQQRKNFHFQHFSFFEKKKMRRKFHSRPIETEAAHFDCVCDNVDISANHPQPTPFLLPTVCHFSHPKTSPTEEKILCLEFSAVFVCKRWHCIDAIFFLSLQHPSLTHLKHERSSSQ